MIGPELRALALPALGTVTALVWEHRHFWGDGYSGALWTRFGRLGAYVLGHGTVAAGFTAWALRTGHGRAAGALWLLSAASGLVVGICWAARVPALPDQIGAHLMRRWHEYRSALHLGLSDRDPGRWTPGTGVH